jgi:meso-butanediol dehydrogenase/(S,S)-butanediol dehydrogenase/diacetyl reductase
MGRLEGKTSVVTGAASGIGLAVGRRFRQEGARVLLANRDASGVRQAADEIGGNAAVLDVLDEGAIARLAAQVKQDWGALDILANAAGVTSSGTVLSTSSEEFDRSIGINPPGTFLTCTDFLPLLERARGSIVNLASNIAFVAIPRRAAYCASKGGVLALTRAIAIDDVASGIRCNALCPGTIRTPFIKRVAARVRRPPANAAHGHARGGWPRPPSSSPLARPHSSLAQRCWPTAAGPRSSVVQRRALAGSWRQARQANGAGCRQWTRRANGDTPPATAQTATSACVSPPSLAQPHPGPGWR